MLIAPGARVVTFYSFKGGVGRTMLLANTAYRLANKHGLRVIAVDWDLEAPGLHRFFGLSAEDAAKAPGVLDYLDEWRAAVHRQDAEAPDVTGSLIPITDKKHAPRFGSLSLLTAGRIDAGYDTRLAALDWQEFYQSSAGASAVETLRAQLADQADVILIDSRTGYTDAGGICTIQLPDGVVLVTAPNQQSLEGIDRVARSIAQGSPEARAGRDRPRLWFVVSRVPLVEETYLAEQWFARHESWFAEGKKSGLWRDEDHPEGIQSHKIPHRGRWGFDEAVLNEAAKADSGDLLLAPYDRFAETLARWLRGEPPMALEARRGADTKPIDTKDIAALEAAVADAERRGDIPGMAAKLLDLATALIVLRRADQAIRRAEQASGIFLSRGAQRERIQALYLLGWALTNERRYDEALAILTDALETAHKTGILSWNVAILSQLAEVHLRQSETAAALRQASEAALVAEQIPDNKSAGSFWLLGDLFGRLARPNDAVRFFRRSAHLARAATHSDMENNAITSLLELSNKGVHLDDADALRARLAELINAATEQPEKPTQKKPRKKLPPR